MLMSASGDYSHEIEMARNLIQEAGTHSDAKEQKIYLQKADELLTMVWDQVKHTHTETLGDNLSVRNLNNKLRTVENEIPLVLAQRDLNLKPSKASSTIEMEAFLPAPKEKGLAETLRKADELLEQKVDDETIANEVKTLLSAYRKGEPVDVEKIKILLDPVKSRLQKVSEIDLNFLADGGMEEQSVQGQITKRALLDSLLQSQLEQLLENVTHQIPPFKKDAEAVRSEPLSVIAKTLIELKKNKGDNLSADGAANIRKGISLYQRAFDEKAKAALLYGTREEQLAVLEASTFFLEPNNTEKAHHLGRLSAAMVTEGKKMDHLFKEMNLDTLPSPMRKAFEEGFAAGLKGEEPARKRELLKQFWNQE